MTRTRTVLLAAVLFGASAAPAALAAGATSSEPTFRSYHGPDSAKDARGRSTGADRAGEPTVGVNPKTGAVMFMAALNTFRVDGFDLGTDEAATWTDVTDPVIGAQTSDPMLITDPVTGRTFANQLELQGGSLQAYTDDDGASWTHSTMGGSVGIAFDHQSIVTGKPTPGSIYQPLPATGYPNLVYYCTNDLADASCAASVDGGLNFLAATPVYTSASSNCSKIFGHLKTDPRNGTLYLPPDGCGNGQAIYRSSDSTQTWVRKDIPTGAGGAGTDGDAGHPSITVADDGTLYLAYGSADGSSGSGYQTGRTHVVVSTTQGDSWTDDTALGLDRGIVASRFPVVVAGDGDRAVVGFLGSTVAGDPSYVKGATDTAPSYVADWRLYLSYTVDRGRTWTTYDATPDSPVQVGAVCTKGTTCLSGRNLLDFNDLDLDLTGRPIVALADGCLKPAAECSDAEGVSKALLVRQGKGIGLRAAQDSVNLADPTTVVPESPLALLLPLAAVGVLAVGLRRRRAHALP